MQWRGDGNRRLLEVRFCGQIKSLNQLDANEETNDAMPMTAFKRAAQRYPYGVFALILLIGIIPA